VTGAVVAFGDSVTDTGNTTGDANQRWPDHLARRLTGLDRPTLSVVNTGMGGNCLLNIRDGEPRHGEPGLDRLERDAFAQTGMRVIIMAEDLIAGYQRAIDQAHARGPRIIGGTVTPFRSSISWAPARGEVWRAVNSWIRTAGAFDGVVDFAAAVAAPGDPLTLHAACDGGDHLHPNDTGTRTMAEAIDLDMLLGPL
jgi:lysophospholipase L1-like esterase